MKDSNPFKSKQFIIFSIIIGVIAIVLAVGFALNRSYDCHWPLDESLFGTFGDFIGGVLGTVVALYSAYLLIQTLKSQESVNKDVKETNKSVIATNRSVIQTNQSALRANKAAIKASENEAYYSEIMLFDTGFKSYLDSYRDTKRHNSEIFDKIVKSFLDIQFDNNNDYYRRTDSASYEYADFYAKNRDILSVHYRTLYLLVSYISESRIDDEEKKIYAKLVRGQLSESEILLLRYNCLSIYGIAAREHCNMYNLLKHLPIMSLLEFNKYRKELKDAVKNEIKDNDKSEAEYHELVGGLDMMFITLRKMITNIFFIESSIHAEYDPGNSNRVKNKYKILLDTNKQRTVFMFSIIKDESVTGQGGGYRTTAAEKAMNKLKVNSLHSLFKDFLNETCFVSNFYLYNGDSHKENVRSIQNGKINTYEYKIDMGKRLILSKYQQ